MNMISRSLLIGFLCAGSAVSLAEVAPSETPSERRAPDTSANSMIIAVPRAMPPITPKDAFKRYALSSCLHFAFKSEELRADAAESIGFYYRTGHVSLNKAAKIKSLVDSMLVQPSEKPYSRPYRAPRVDPLIVQCINLSNSEAIENLFAAPETTSK